jgi:phenolic acid decarboxylase
MLIVGKTMEYGYENGDAYRILFGDKTITWKCLAGLGAGESGTEFHDAVEVAPNVLFVSWVADNGESLSMVANLEQKIIHFNSVYHQIRHFWRGKITYFGSAKAAQRRDDLPPLAPNQIKYGLR